MHGTGPDSRLFALKSWLATQSAFGLDPAGLAPASSDASFRRYFRLPSESHGSLIVMDAPPDKEDCRPFIAVAAALTSADVSAPRVLAENLADGFLILTDLGNTTYLEAFKSSSSDQTRRLMLDALAALHLIQERVPAADLPPYDETLLMREMQLFIDWYLERHCGFSPSDADRSMLKGLFRTLVDSALAQPQVAVHRDYHSRNLMVIAAGQEHGNPGVLDFQDAVAGASTYDLVSLLRDAYITWPEEEVLDYAVRFWEGARRTGLELSSDFADFWQSFEFMGLQRHLKVLGIFARLSHRDGKHGYLNDLPVVLNYVRAVAARYRIAAPLLGLLDRASKQQPAVGLTF